MSKKKIIIISVSTLLTFVIGLGIIFFTQKDDKTSKTYNKSSTSPSSSNEESVMLEEPENEEKFTENQTEITDDGTGIKLDETINSDYNLRTGEKAEEPAKPITPKYPEDVSNPINKEKQYIQDADPETGKSWDGVSPIIYRLQSGKETYTKTYGAYYEIRPDDWVLLEEPTNEEEWDGKCHHCGKAVGDGKNNTCVRWMMSNQKCQNCKAQVPVNTCHTCNE